MNKMRNCDRALLENLKAKYGISGVKNAIRILNEGKHENTGRKAVRINEETEETIGNNPKGVAFSNAVRVAVQEVLRQMKGGSSKSDFACLIWDNGAWEASKNCASKEVAAAAGRMFQRKGYFVAWKLMGQPGYRWCRPGTPIELCIFEEIPEHYNSFSYRELE